MDRLSLVRSDHTCTVVSNKAYIFGGETASGKLASNDIHFVTFESSGNPEPDYSVVPAVPDVEGQPVPAARTKHAACHFNVCVAIFGGLDESGKLVDDEPFFWLYNTAKSAWETLKSEKSEISPVQRSGAKLFNLNNKLVLYGGVDANGTALKDVWHFDYVSKAWTALASAPVSTSNAAMSAGHLYLIDGEDNMSSNVHSLDLNVEELVKAEWTTTSFPTNPLTPGPRPRVGGGLLPISTGYGRNYLLYFFGARQNPHSSDTTSPEDTEDPTQWSDTWTFQVVSSQPEVKPTTSFSDAIKPSAIKDAIRSKLGYDSGKHSWAEVEVQPPGDLVEGQGKVHPGPRAFFGCDFVASGSSVVVWGGVNAKGEREGDGWVISFS
jgi:hypothetical protein